jgi:hypothetical protein
LIQTFIQKHLTVVDDGSRPPSEGYRIH